MPKIIGNHSKTKAPETSGYVPDHHCRFVWVPGEEPFAEREYGDIFIVGV